VGVGVQVVDGVGVLVEVGVVEVVEVVEVVDVVLRGQSGISGPHSVRVLVLVRVDVDVRVVVSSPVAETPAMTAAKAMRPVVKRIVMVVCGRVVWYRRRTEDWWKFLLGELVRVNEWISSREKDQQSRQ